MSEKKRRRKKKHFSRGRKQFTLPLVKTHGCSKMEDKRMFIPGTSFVFENAGKINLKSASLSIPVRSENRRVIRCLAQTFFKTTVIQKSLETRYTRLNSSFFLFRQVTRPSYECFIYRTAEKRRTIPRDVFQGEGRENRRKRDFRRF